jgi:hypothetical protein
MMRPRVKSMARKRASSKASGPALDDGVHAALSSALFEGRLTPAQNFPNIVSPRSSTYRASASARCCIASSRSVA